MWQGNNQNWFANAISGIGQKLNAPVIFDWDTDAARYDANMGSSKRDSDSQAAINSRDYLSKPETPNSQLNRAGHYLNPAQDPLVQRDVGQIANTYSGGADNYWAGSGGGVTGGGYAGGGAAAGPSYDPNEVARYDQAISQINQAKSRLGDQLGIARQNIGDQYSTNLNELKSVFNRANRDYESSTTQNSQNFRTNTNNINDKASIGMRGLQRLLGSYGAVGSDMGVASDAVTDVASAERSGANSTFANNQRGLDTNWFDFQEQDKNSRSKLNDWRTRSVRSAEQQSKQTEQDLLSQLARLQGERAQVTGGSFAGASQSAIDQANRLGSQIDQLGRFKPTYSGKTPVYQQKALDSYTNNSDATIATSALPGGIQNRYLAQLLGEEDEERLF